MSAALGPWAQAAVRSRPVKNMGPPESNGATTWQLQPIKTLPNWNSWSRSPQTRVGHQILSRRQWLASSQAFEVKQSTRINKDQQSCPKPSSFSTLSPMPAPRLLHFNVFCIAAPYNTNVAPPNALILLRVAVPSTGCGNEARSQLSPKNPWRLMDVDGSIFYWLVFWGLGRCSVFF